MDMGRFVTASTCNAPNPPDLMDGVLYMAGLLVLFRDGMIAVLLISLV